MPAPDLLTSGQLAAFVGRSRETIRRYEALGLIPAGRRDPVNRRRYWTIAEAERIRRSLQPTQLADLPSTGGRPPDARGPEANLDDCSRARTAPIR